MNFKTMIILIEDYFFYRKLVKQSKKFNEIINKNNMIKSPCTVNHIPGTKYAPINTPKDNLTELFIRYYNK